MSKQARHLKKILRTWMLPISMTTGVVAYFIYAGIPWLNFTHQFASQAALVIQPVLIFLMLFITFCKIEPHNLKIEAWHVWLLSIQATAFTALAMFLYFHPNMALRPIVEGAMLCVVCPPATAAAVVTEKLGGSAAGITSYTILMNLVAAILVPIIVPLAHPANGIAFFHSFLLIMGNVFPTLIFPFVCALVVRRFFPAFHKKVTQTKDLAFYIWGFTLPIAIAITTHSIVSSTVAAIYQVGIAAVSLVCCALQFFVGKRIGRHFGSQITAGQSLGQKNTIFAIWMGYTFLTPVSSIAGGFYSVWHNLYNSWQLYQKEKRTDIH